MALNITASTAGDACVLRCEGRITLGEGSVSFRDAARETLRKGAKFVVLDLGGVDYIDSSGIGELVSAYTVARNSGANLVLAGLRTRVSDLLQTTKLNTVFQVFDSADAALDSLKPGVSQVKP
jgi:anti-sigma B factor antagonist